MLNVFFVIEVQIALLPSSLVFITTMEAFIDQRVRAMFHFPRRIPLSVYIRNFL